MLEPRYVLYSFYEEEGFRKFIYWDTKEKTFAISENRKSGIIAKGFSFFMVSLMDFFGIKFSLGPYISNSYNLELLIFIPLITLLIFKILTFIQNNKEKDFYDLNINDTDTLMKIIYKTRTDMIKFIARGEGSAVIILFIFTLGILYKIPVMKQLFEIFLFYLVESIAIVAFFIMYLPGYKIAKELKQQYPLSLEKDDKK